MITKWNRCFLATNNEGLVNQKLYMDYQGNRNPYVDFPDL